MTWTAEQEDFYQFALPDGVVGMPEARKKALHDLDVALGTAYAEPHHRELADHLRTHGAELIALIEPFVERKE